MKPLWVPNYMSALIFQSITDARSFLMGDGSGKPEQARKACVNAQMHTQGSHYAAVGFPRVECSGNGCHSNLTDGPQGTERQGQRESERMRGREIGLQILLNSAAWRSPRSTPWSKAGTPTVIFLLTHQGNIQNLDMGLVLHLRNTD